MIGTVDYCADTKTKVIRTLSHKRLVPVHLTIHAHSLLETERTGKREQTAGCRYRSDRGHHGERYTFNYEGIKKEQVANSKQMKKVTFRGSDTHPYPDLLVSDDVQ